MNIRQLIIFQKVCETLHFTQAAKALYMSQPAVSKAVKELEEELGFALFERIHHQIYLTQSGVLFYEKAQRLLTLYEELENQGTKCNENSILRLGSSITIATDWLPRVLDSLTKAQRKQLCVTIDSASNIEQMLLQNKVDLALIEGVVHDSGLICHPFAQYEMKVVVSKHHPFAKQASVPLAELVKQPLLLREKGSATRDCLDSVLLLHNLFVTPMMTSINSQALLALVSRNFGISILPESIVEPLKQQLSLITLPIQEEALINTLHLVYQKEKYFTPLMQQMKQLVLTSF